MTGRMKFALAGCCFALLMAATASLAFKRNQDEVFVREAASAAMAEVEFARVAATRASSPELRELAAQMVSVHGVAVLCLREIARERGIALPELSSRQQAELARLRSLEGEAFDAQYLLSLMDGAEQVAALFDKHAAEAPEDDLQEFAFRNGPVLHRQLAQVQEAAANAGVATRL